MHDQYAVTEIKIGKGMFKFYVIRLIFLLQK